jgi:hypothetical protein
MCTRACNCALLLAFVCGTIEQACQSSSSGGDDDSAARTEVLLIAAAAEAVTAAAVDALASQRASREAELARAQEQTEQCRQLELALQQRIATVVGIHASAATSSVVDIIEEAPYEDESGSSRAVGCSFLTLICVTLCRFCCAATTHYCLTVFAACWKSPQHAQVLELGPATSAYAPQPEPQPTIEPVVAPTVATIDPSGPTDNSSTAQPVGRRVIAEIAYGASEAGFNAETDVRRPPPAVRSFQVELRALLMPHLLTVCVQLAFEVGEEISVSDDTQDWWQGSLVRDPSQTGMFPSNFVTKA